MEISYWKSRWVKGKTGWHMPEVYPPLKRYWSRLNLDKEVTVLVPLCGKSLDLAWLAGQGHRVIGVEVSEKAILEFLEESNMDYQTSAKGPFMRYITGDITLWAGDFLKLQPSWLPEINVVYDKASLVALPGHQRRSYADHVLSICSSGTRMFLNTFEYPQSEMNGPPFAVFRAELEELYGSRFDIDLLHEESVIEKLSKFQSRGLTSYLIEKVYHLQ